MAITIKNPALNIDIKSVEALYQSWNTPDISLKYDLSKIVVLRGTTTHSIKDFIGVKEYSQYDSFVLVLNREDLSEKIFQVTPNKELPLQITANGQEITLTFDYLARSITPLGEYRYKLIWEVYGVDNDGTLSLIEIKPFSLELKVYDGNNFIELPPKNLDIIFDAKETNFIRTIKFPFECGGNYRITPVDKNLTIEDKGILEPYVVANFIGELSILTSNSIANLGDETSIVSGFTITNLDSGAIWEWPINIVKKNKPIVPDVYSVNFNTFLGSNENLTAYVQVFADSFTTLEIINNLPWLQVEEVDSYFHIYKVSIINLENLSSGNYSGSFGISNNSQSAVINVTLGIQYWLIYKDNWLMFAQDKDYIELNTSLVNTSALIEADIQYKLDDGVLEEQEKWGVSFFRNRAKFHIGNELKNIIKFNNAPPLLAHGKIIAPNPSTINFGIKELNKLNNGVVNYSGSHSRQYYNGITPPTKTVDGFFILQYDKNYIRATENSILSFSYINKPTLAKILKLILVYKNNTQIDAIQVQNSVTMSSIFRKYDDLKPGDEIVFKLNELGDEKRYKIIPKGKESFHIYFKENWQSVECFEFTGNISHKVRYNFINFLGYKLFKEYLKRVSTAKEEVFQINTGYIFKENSDIIDRIIESDKCWIRMPDNTSLEIIPLSKDLLKYDSDRNLYSYNLEFRVNYD